MGCWVDVDDVRPYPSCAQRTAVVPKPMRMRLRTACTATCGSFAQAWMQMSPPERAGSSRSPWNPGRSASAAGRRSGMPSLSKNVLPKPIVTVSDDGGRSSASPVSAGGASGLCGRAPFSAVSSPRARRSVAMVHWLNMRWTVALPVEVRSSAVKYSSFCDGVTIPAWCVPRKATTSCPGGATGPSGRPSA